MFLVSCSSDIKFHSCPSYDLIQTYRPTDINDGYIRNISLSKDGLFLVLVPYQGIAEILRTKDLHLLQPILNVPQLTTAVFQRTTKRNLAISTVSGYVLLYDIKLRCVRKQFPTPDYVTSMLDWSVRDSYLAAGGTDLITLYNNATNQIVRVIDEPNFKSLSTVRFHCTQKPILGAANNNGTIIIWNIDVGKAIYSAQSHKALVTDLAFSIQNHNLLVSCGLDQTFYCYDLDSCDIALSVRIDEPLSAVDMASDGCTLAISSTRGNIFIYDLRKPRQPVTKIAAHTGEIKRIYYEPAYPDRLRSNYFTDENLSQFEADDMPNISLDAIGDMINIVKAQNQIFDSKKTADTMDENSLFDEIAFEGKDALNFTQNSPNMSKLQDGDASRLQHNNSKSNCSPYIVKTQNQKKTDDMTNETSFFTEMSLNNIFERKDISNIIQNTSNLSEFQNIDTSLEYNKNKDNMKNSRPCSSTPEQNSLNSSFFQQNGLNFSSITHSNSGDLKQIIKNIVSEVVAEHMTDLTDIISRHFLNLQMFFSKQFIYTEEHIDKIRNDILRTCVDSNLMKEVKQLRESNEILKKQINDLREANSTK